MGVIEVNNLESLNEILDNNENVVVDFHAMDWCVPCQRLAPHYEAVFDKMDTVKFLSVDIDRASHELVESYQVSGVPTVLAFKNGAVVEKIEQRFHSAPRLTSKLTELYS